MSMDESSMLIIVEVLWTRGYSVTMTEKKVCCEAYHRLIEPIKLPVLSTFSALVTLPVP